jgi:DNA invertase Pin-like site-specific DNA recombinase
MQLTPLDLVIRTSQRKQDAQSPAQQRQLAAQVCAAGGYRIALTHDSGRSESGKTMERAALRAVQARVRSGETAGVVVAYLDRLGRARIEESMAFVRELVGDGGILVAADWGTDAIDLSDPNVEDMLVFRMQMNRSQWSKAAARYKLSQRNAVEAGKFVGPTPLGYLREKGRLLVDPVVGPHITEAYRRAANESIAAARDYLLTAVPGRKWTTSEVRRVLASRAYLGESWCWDGEKRTVNTQAHAPLTTLANHAAAGEKGPRSRAALKAYPLSGVARCVCGAPLTGQFIHKIKGQVRDYRRYRCSSPTCTGGSSVDATRLEDYVRTELAEVLVDTTFRAQFAPNGLDDALRTWQRAQAELTEYMADPELAAMGAAFKAGAKMRQARAQAAEAAYRKLAGRATWDGEWPAADELHKPEVFARALQLMLKAGVVPFVRRGQRGGDTRSTRPDIALRVGWTTLDGDEVAGVLAA